MSMSLLKKTWEMEKGEKKKEDSFSWEKWKPEVGKRNLLKSWREAGLSSPVHP